MNSHILVCIGITLIIAGLSIFYWDSLVLMWIESCTGVGGHWGPRIYYDGSGAPDGWYDVWCSEGSSNGSIFFPMCPSAPTRLHGTWKTNVIIPPNFDGYVYLQNNIIVEIRK